MVGDEAVKADGIAETQLRRPPPQCVLERAAADHIGADVPE